MLIFGAVIHQQQEPRRRHPLAQQVEPGLRLTVQPVQILHDQEHGLIETLSHKQPLHGLERALPADLRVHLCQGRARVSDAQEGEEVGQGVF